MSLACEPTITFLASGGHMRPAFAVEEEWPIVIRQEFMPSSDSSLPLKFRPSDFGIIPYLELSPLHGSLLPITEVVCGPSANPEWTKKAAEALLRQAGYS